MLEAMHTQPERQITQCLFIQAQSFLGINQLHDFCFCHASIVASSSSDCAAHSLSCLTPKIGHAHWWTLCCFCAAAQICHLCTRPCLNPGFSLRAPCQVKTSPAVKQEAFLPLTEDDVIACLKQWGELSTSQLTERLSMKQRGEADKKAFTGLVKKVAMLQTRPDGRKVVVLRPGK